MHARIKQMFVLLNMCIFEYEYIRGEARLRQGAFYNAKMSPSGSVIM
jgi:hypothetical protein